MKVVQVIKKLNNTELGKAGTNDSYVLVPNELDVTDVFTKLNESFTFVDKETSEEVILRNTHGREKRIVGLGQYYRKHDLSAGDEVMFERRETGAKVSHFICVRKREDTLVIQKFRYGFEILTPERIDKFQNIMTDSGEYLELRFLVSQKKQNNSPEPTSFYDVIVSGESILDSFSAKEIGEVEIQGGKIVVNSSYGWKKYIFETEEKK